MSSAIELDEPILANVNGEVVNTDNITASSGTLTLDADNTVLTGTITLNGQTMTFPVNSGNNGYVLSTNGSGTLNWVAQSGGGGSTTRIENAGTTTQVDTDRVGFSNLVYIKANSVDAVVVSSTETKINNKTNIEGSISFTPTITSTNNYVVAASDSSIIWEGTANGSVTLPLSDTDPGRKLLIYNKSNFSVSVTPSVGETIDGTATPISMDSMFDSVELQSDGVDNWMVV